jgi:hypothetical protein
LSEEVVVVCFFKQGCIIGKKLNPFNSKNIKYFKPLKFSESPVGTISEILAGSIGIEAGGGPCLIAHFL